jgi:hypothetical protein
MNPNLLTSAPVWTAAGWTMLHLMWVGAVIGLTASLVRRIFRIAQMNTKTGPKRGRAPFAARNYRTPSVGRRVG